MNPDLIPPEFFEPSYREVNKAKGTSDFSLSEAIFTIALTVPVLTLIWIFVVAA